MRNDSLVFSLKRKSISDGYKANGVGTRDEEKRRPIVNGRMHATLLRALKVNGYVRCKSCNIIRKSFKVEAIRTPGFTTSGTDVAQCRS